MALVWCDKCNHAFDFTVGAIMRRREDEEDVEEVGLQCPRCLHEIIAYRTNTPIRKLQQKLNRVMLRYSDPKYKLEDVDKQVRRLKTQLKSAMDELNAKYSG